MSNKKFTLWRKAKARNTEHLWGKYRQIKNDLKHMVKRKYDDYITSLGGLCRSNPKRFWSFFRSKTKSRSTPASVIKDTIELSDPQAKAIAFNDYFCSVFLPPDSCDLPLAMRNVTPILLPCFTVEEVISVLSEIDVNKASAQS